MWQSQIGSSKGIDVIIVVRWFVAGITKEFSAEALPSLGIGPWRRRSAQDVGLNRNRRAQRRMDIDAESAGSP